MLLGLVGLSIAVSVGSNLWAPQLRSLAFFGYFGLFCLGALASASLFLPGLALVLTLPAGFVLNPIAVGVSVAAGATLGELTGYFAGKAGRNIAVQNGGKLWRAIDVLFQRRGTTAVFIVAIVPGPVFDFAGIMAGSSGMPIVRFLLATFAGKSIRFCLTALIGAVLGNTMSDWKS